MQTPLKGFTLVELMITIVIAGILASVALPSLSSWYERSRADSEIGKIQEALKFARNQAFSYGGTVVVCPNSGGNACKSTSDWSDGIRVYFEVSNETIKVIEGIHSKDKITGTTVKFGANGLAESAATFIYCPNGKSAGSKSVDLSVTGLIKTGANDKSCGSI